jgi:hypothetical protein
MHARRSYSGNECGGKRLQKKISEVVMSGTTRVGRTVEVRIGYFSSFIIV